MRLFYVCPSVITSKMINISAHRLHRPLQSYIFWKLFKNHKWTQIQRQRQWIRQRQRRRQSAWNTQHVLYCWKADDSLIPNMIIDTSPCLCQSALSPWSPRSPCSGRIISSTGPSVSPFWDFSFLVWIFIKCIPPKIYSCTCIPFVGNKQTLAPAVWKTWASKQKWQHTKTPMGLGVQLYNHCTIVPYMIGQHTIVLVHVHINRIVQHTLALVHSW